MENTDKKLQGEKMLTDLSNKNVVHVKKEKIEYLQFRKLLEYKDIINHAYSIGININFRTAINGKTDISKNQYDLAKKSYRSLCEAMGCKYNRIVKPRQGHTNNVRIVKSKINVLAPDFNLKKYKATDGLITKKKNIILSTTNADCILFLFLDPVRKVIANVHSGWKGTLQRIVVQAINKMINEFECKPEDIICCICPSIRKCHFEVSRDVKDMFEKEFINVIGGYYIDKNGNNISIKYSDIIEHKHEKWNIDTVLINKIIMQNMGLKPENIIDSEICSMCNPQLIHSYRNEKEGFGLETALIELKK